MRNTLLLTLLALGLVVVAQERSTPDLSPSHPMPENWAVGYESSLGERQTMPTDDAWWHNFGDATLDSLISLGESNSYDVLAAMKRIESARLAIDEAKSAYWPTVGVSAAWQDSRISGATGPQLTSAQKERYWSLGLSASWEIDIFGRIAENVKAQKAGWQASRAECAAVQTTLAANIAKAYFDLRAQQALYEVAKQQILSQEKIYNMTNARYEAGLNSKLNVTQSRLTVVSTESSLPAIQASIDADIIALAILVGTYPDEIRPMLVSNPSLPRYGGSIDIGTPSDLLRRRPDILQAEASVAQLAAECGIAKKDFLPTLSIEANAGTDSREISNLLKKNSFGYNIAPTLSWTIFDGLARNYRTRAAKINLEAGIDSYNNTVMAAWQEVENGLVQYRAANQRIEMVKEMLELSQTGLDLAVIDYKDGLVPYSDVKDMQLDLLNYQQEYINNHLQILTDLVSIYEALGGGW